jgi:mannose-1-phosphate guanylyltransferase
MNLTGEASLLQQTVARLQPLIPPSNVWVFTNDYLTRSIAAQLPQVPPSQIVAEPVQRNTAPCVGLAAELISARDPQAVLGVFPSDHVVMKPTAFRATAALALNRASRGNMVVCGIQPRWAETGYGYIEFPARPDTRRPKALPVKKFREKPNLKAAQAYLRAGRFFWNSGMFFAKASVIREALQRYLPETAAVLKGIAEAHGNGRGFARVLKNRYGECQNISLDYAVLEKSPEVIGIPCEIGWSDVGSWRAAYDLLLGKGQANVLRSEAILVDSAGLYIDAPKKLVAAVGVRDLVIVDVPDALLIVPRDRAQDVSRLVAELEKAGREELL